MGKNGAKYKYLRLPLATPEEAAKRREHLIKVGTIVPVSERYACACTVPVTGPYCQACGTATVLWK